MSVIDFCWCRRGLICVVHPRKPFPHAQCTAGEAPCARPECAYGREYLRRAIAMWRREARGMEGVARTRDEAPPEELLARAELAENLLSAWERDHASRRRGAS
jgi:hypothetical protein